MIDMKIWMRKMPAVAPRVFSVPANCRAELCRLYDAYFRKPHNQDHSAKHDLWAFVASFAPDVATGSWMIDTSNILDIKIREIGGGSRE